MNPVLAAALKRREKIQEKLDKLLAKATDEARELTEAEAETFESLAERRGKLDRQITGLEKEEARKATAAAAAAGKPDPAEPKSKRNKRAAGDAVIRFEPGTYREDALFRRGEASFLMDMATVACAAQRIATEGDPHVAEDRLRQNEKEVRIDLAKANDAEQRNFHRWLGRENGSVESRTNPNTTAGTGGEFVPPLWLVSQYVPFQRPTRTFANRVRNLSLPGGIDVINIPKITVGSLTGVQSTQGGAVASRDIATSTVSAKVNTIAGQEDISMQLLEQSPLSMDGVIFDDLSRDYDLQLDGQILVGSGANGQHQGVLTLTSATSNTDITKANAVTVASALFHDTSTAGTQYRAILNGKNQIEVLRIAPATAIWVHPRRANSWEYSAVDTQGRPLFVAYSPFNALGLDNPNIPEGTAGALLGLPVVKDGNMPTTMSGTGVTGGTADPIVVLKEDDLYLWEGTMRMRALPEILSGTLQIRFQVYSYSAFLPNRFAPSISILTGNTGLAAPGF